MDVRFHSMRTLSLALTAFFLVVQMSGAENCLAREGEVGGEGCGSALMQIRSLGEKHHSKLGVQRLVDDVKALVHRGEIVDEETLNGLRSLVDTWSQEISDEFLGVEKSAKEKLYSYKNIAALDQSMLDDWTAHYQGTLAELKDSMIKEWDQLYMDSTVCYTWKKKKGYTYEQVKNRCEAKGYYTVPRAFYDSCDDGQLEYAEAMIEKFSRSRTANKRLDAFEYLCLMDGLFDYHCSIHEQRYNEARQNFAADFSALVEKVKVINSNAKDQQFVTCLVGTMGSTPTGTVQKCEDNHAAASTDKYELKPGDYTFPEKEKCDSEQLDKDILTYGAGYEGTQFNHSLFGMQSFGWITNMSTPPLKMTLGEMFDKTIMCGEGTSYHYDELENKECNTGGLTSMDMTIQKSADETIQQTKGRVTDTCKRACNLSVRCRGFTVEVMNSAVTCKWISVTSLESASDCHGMGPSLHNTMATCHQKTYTIVPDPCPKSDTAPIDMEVEDEDFP